MPLYLFIFMRKKYELKYLLLDKSQKGWTATLIKFHMMGGKESL